MTDIVKLQNDVGELYRKSFGSTPLSKRLDYIREEALELHVAPNLKAMKDEAGDLMSCLFAFMDEMGFNAEEILALNLDKIQRRYDSGQYASLGRKTQVCLIGGAFDPPHIGHYQLGEFLLSVKLFDEVWYVPAYRHMHGKQMTDANHRLKMLQIMTQNNGRMKVCDYEIRHKLAGETYHFLNRLMVDEEYSDSYNFSYAIGLDNANHFDTWVNYELLKDLIPFIVVARKGIKPNPDITWYREGRHKFFAAESNIKEVSSSAIRDALNSPLGVSEDETSTGANDLSDAVYQYICDNELYGVIE